MTTEELIKRLKGLGFTARESGTCIRVDTGDVEMNYSKNISPNDGWAKALPLIAEYYQTPLDERKSEKNYRLRWIDCNDPDIDCATYLGLRMGAGNISYWVTCGKESATVFNEERLENIKRGNPRFAPAIDAMKEEVKDDESNGN